MTSVPVSWDTLTMTTTCVPEWCELGAEPHSDVCDNAQMEAMTKKEFVSHLETAARHALDAYRFLIEDEESPDDAYGQAVEDVREYGVCYAGIGSCGRGWCHHG